MVASTGERIHHDVIERAVELSRRGHTAFYVLSIAQIYGSALGLQHPGLYPTKREWQAQADIVSDAVKALRRRGFEAEGRVLGTRNPSKTIVREALRSGCEAIVMGTWPFSWWRRLLMQDQASWVVRRTTLPVHLVSLPAKH